MYLHLFYFLCYLINFVETKQLDSDTNISNILNEREQEEESSYIIGPFTQIDKWKRA